MPSADKIPDEELSVEKSYGWVVGCHIERDHRSGVHVGDGHSGPVTDV